MNNKKPLFVTGIGTGVGKTIISALLVEKFQADYWKPVQSGDLEYTDTDMVKSLVSNPVSKFHPETYRLTQPFSPHKAAELDGITIQAEQFILSDTQNRLVIEGAGGLMVPLNKHLLMIDLIKKFDAEVIIVVKHYLGSINHTLLSLALLNQRQIPVKCLIFNGTKDEYSERAILDFNSTLKYAFVDEISDINKASILDAAGRVNF